MELVMRKDIPEELTWDLTAIYQTEEDMYQDAKKLQTLCDSITENYKGKLDTPEKINSCLDDFREVQRLLMMTGYYCDLAVAVDYYDAHNQERNEEILPWHPRSPAPSAL